MKPSTYHFNLPAARCFNTILSTHIFLLYRGIKTLYRKFVYYWIINQFSRWFYGTKKKKVLVGLYQIDRKNEAQFWLDPAQGKLLKIFSINPLKGATPYWMKTEEGIGENGIGLPNSSPPSSVFIDRKSTLLLINKFIDYNYRIYSDPIPISSKTIFEIKTTNEEEKQAGSVDKYLVFHILLSLRNSVTVLTNRLSSKTQVIMPAITTSFFRKRTSYFTMNQIICPAKQRTFPPARNGQSDRLFPRCRRLAQVASLPTKPARWGFTSCFLSLCYSVIYNYMVFSPVTSIL